MGKASDRYRQGAAALGGKARGNNLAWRRFLEAGERQRRDQLEQGVAPQRRPKRTKGGDSP
jgi:hypothetical protein